MIQNIEIAKILREIGGYYEMKNEPFKPRAYEKAADSLEALGEEVENILSREGEKGLLAIPGVGKGIADHIQEMMKTGRLKIYEKMKKDMPVNLGELLEIEGIGPKTAKTLYKKFGIRNRKDLERASKKHLVSPKITAALEVQDPKNKRYIMGYQFGLVNRIAQTLQDSGLFKKIEVGGSFRRRQDTIGDVDILAVAKNPAKAMEFFVNLPEAAGTIEHGKSKSEVRLASGMQVDLRIVPAESWGAALIYFTGDLAHNIALRKIAIDKGLKLSEYGLTPTSPPPREGEEVRGLKFKSEEEVYHSLGMDYIPPEIRTDTGEIELAQKHKLPHLIDYGEVRGDLQVQTNWTDGTKSIEDMAVAAMKLGREYIAITDHTQSLKIANGLDEKRLMAQMKEIDRLNSKFKIQHSKFRILKGAEVNILKDGSLDIEDKILAKLDVVGVSIHSHMKMQRADMTARLKKALSHPLVDIYFHPTTRLINRRAPIDFDFEEVLKVVKKNKIAMEINAYPERSDLRDTLIRKTVEAGVKLMINSDAHAISHLDFIKFGEGAARRGWATKSDILNTRSAVELLKYFKGK